VLNRIEINNFRCLRNVDVPMRPLTVLIGPNDSGKSAFLAAIESLLHPGLMQFSDFFRCDPTNGIRIVGHAANGSVINSWLPEGSSTSAHSHVATRLQPCQRFQLPSAGIEMECEGYSEGDEQALDLAVRGERIPAFFDYLLRRDRGRFAEVVQALRESIPGLEDIDIATPQPSRRRIDCVIEQGVRLPASMASVGVRMLMFFISLAYHPRPPKTILIEEPETGLHPKRLEQVMQLLQSVSAGKYGDYGAQIVLTTHSPFVLNCVDLATDQVLVFRRTADGSRVCEPVDPERLKDFLGEFMLGEIWFNEEEAGLVAKP
jgi:energy-coupling factor transporter ATP-binding protein EcfA2